MWTAVSRKRHDWGAPLQVALITVLAQIGCRVPASFASIRCVDRLFARMGTGDSIETNSSSFMVEMQVATISLDVGDEDSGKECGIAV